MAIKLFNTGVISDLSSLYSFIDTNKAGTFLENCTIALGTGNTSITFTKGDITASYITTSETGTPTILSYTGGTRNFSITATTTSGGSYGYSRLSGAVLCKNALILRVFTHCAYSTSSNDFIRYVVITPDSNGELAVMCSRNKNSTLSFVPPVSSTNNEEEMVNCGYVAISKDSIAGAVGWCRPTFDCQLTTLCPVALNTASGDITLPNAFVMVNSQLTIDGTDYATNGWWCFKD